MTGHETAPLKLMVPYKFATLLIIAHGEDLRTKFEDFFKVPKVSPFMRAFSKVKETLTAVARPSRHYKLTLSGLTGNVTQGSSTLDRLYFEIPRILAHDRTLSPLEKLHEVQKKVRQDFDFEYHEAVQHRGHKLHIDETPNEYQREPLEENANWAPPPTNIRTDRQYYFTANPFGVTDRRSGVPEKNDFGLWLVDASLDIATSIETSTGEKLLPGSGSNNRPISLLSMLGIQLSTARTPNSADTSGATKISLFTIMIQLMSLWGTDIHINVIDITCRYFNWDKHFPGIKKQHDEGQRIFKFGKRFPLRLVGYPFEKFGKWSSGEIASPTARNHDDYFPEYVDVNSSTQVPVEEWYYDGKIRIGNQVYSLENQSGTVLVHPTQVDPKDYEVVTVQIKGSKPLHLDTTTFFLPNTFNDVITNGNGIETTHDIKVFYVQRDPFFLIVTLTRKPTALGIQSRYTPENNAVITAYLKFEGINPTNNTRSWTMNESVLTALIAPHTPSFRTEALLSKKRRHSSPEASSKRRHSSSPTSSGGKNKRRKPRTLKRKKTVKVKKPFRKYSLKTKTIK